MPNKILVVDDEKSFVKANKTSILTNRDNYIIKTAFNGKEALDILEKEEVDLIILDVKMPVMDGIQFLVELHNRNIWLPIIILTSFSNIAEKEKEEIIRDFGVVEIIEKPVNFEKLEKRIEEVLNHFKEYKYSIPGIDLKTILQVLEIEKKTGILTVNLGKKDGRIFFRKGNVVDVEVKGLSAEEAFNECLKDDYREKKRSIEYINHKKIKKINKSLTGMLLDTSRLEDEKKKTIKGGKNGFRSSY